MTTKQFLKKNERILNFASMDSYCGFPAGTFSAVMRGKIKFDSKRVEIFLALLQRLADHCVTMLENGEVPATTTKKKKGHRK